MVGFLAQFLRGTGGAQTLTDIPRAAAAVSPFVKETRQMVPSHHTEKPDLKLYTSKNRLLASQGIAINGSQGPPDSQGPHLGNPGKVTKLPKGR